MQLARARWHWHLMLIPVAGTGSMHKEPYPSDAYPPQAIARTVARLGMATSRADTLTSLVLAVRAGAFLSCGALMLTVVVAESGLGLGPTRLLRGVSLCLGLMLVVMAGTALFTANNLITRAWASRLGVPTYWWWHRGAGGAA